MLTIKNNYLKLRLTVLLIFSCNYSVFAELPQHATVPGGVAVIELPINVEQVKEPNVHFYGKKVLTYNENNIWYAIIGLPLDINLGTHKIICDNKTLYFDVNNKEYPIEHLKLPENMVTPNQQIQERINKEYKEIIDLYNNYSEQMPENLIFLLPVVGRISSEFGIKRYLNGKPKNAHSGLDIAAKIGDPVFAPMSGKVINVKQYYYNGNMIFLDHGAGLISSYCHLNKTLVNTNDVVSVGEKIGEVGKTGRVTGAHLHWSISLNGVRIDPKYFIAAK